MATSLVVKLLASDDLPPLNLPRLTLIRLIHRDDYRLPGATL